MTAYIVRRLLLIIPTLFGIMLINFAVVQIVPGGPVEQMIAQMTGTAVESTARFSGSGEGENLTNFDISLTTPSIIYDQERVALMSEKMTLAQVMVDSKIVPTDWIYENIFHFSEDQYDEYRDLVREDAKLP